MHCIHYNIFFRNKVKYLRDKVTSSAMADFNLCKFGGSSLATTKKINNVADVILADESRQIVVVSAFGKDSKTDAKVTDLLLSLASHYLSAGTIYEKTMHKINNKLSSIANGLEIGTSIVKEHMTDLEKRVKQHTKNHDQYKDNIAAWGEYTSAKFLTEFLNKKKKVKAVFVDPKDILILSDSFGDAIILPESNEKIRKYFQSPQGIQIVPGFYGYTKSNKIATLPRGGSDTTGGKIAGVIGAKVYENFTDIDFIARASCVENALPIEIMTYEEALELAYMGFSVLKDEAIVPCMEANVPINVRNSFNTDVKGTMILRSREPDKYEVTGIAYMPGFCTLNIRKVLRSRDMHGSSGAYLFETENPGKGIKFPIEHVATGVSNYSYVVPRQYFTAENVNYVIKHLSECFKIPVEDIVPDYTPLSLISIVGQGMRHRLGVSCRAAGAMAQSRLSISFCTEGASEMSIIYGVQEPEEGSLHGQEAVRAIYNEFFVNPIIGNFLKELTPERRTV